MYLFIVLVVVRICVNLMIVCFLDWYEWMMIIDIVIVMSVIVIIMIVCESCLLLFYAFIVVADNYNWDYYSIFISISIVISIYSPISSYTPSQPTPLHTLPYAYIWGQTHPSLPILLMVSQLLLYYPLYLSRMYNMIGWVMVSLSQNHKYFI